MNDHQRYLTLVGNENQLSFKGLRESGITKLAVGKLHTVNSVYRLDLMQAQGSLYRYFNRTLHRPFNCLLLGPPGSGKSYVSKQLADFENIKKVMEQLHSIGIDTEMSGGLQPERQTTPVTKVKFLEYNLSQLHRPDEIIQMFRDIARAAAEPKIVLLDEFDVKIESSSVIRYLIEAMYDGKTSGNYQELSSARQLSYSPAVISRISACSPKFNGNDRELTSRNSCLSIIIELRATMRLMNRIEIRFTAYFTCAIFIGNIRRR